MRRRAQTLVASLIVIAIIAILAVALLGGTRGGESPRKDGLGKTTPGLVTAAAKDDACRANIGQVRGSIMIARTNADDQPPASLADTGLSASYLMCPLGKEAYIYDPQTGAVTCPHLGHEKY